MPQKKVDKLIYNLSGEIKCKLCNNTFKTKLEYPFKTLKLCKECIEKNHDQLYDYVYEITEKSCTKVHSCDIKGKEFKSKCLTWKQLKNYLNEITDEVILNCPVICQEHHHNTYIRCNPVIEVRLNDEVKWAIEGKEFDGDEIRIQYELMLNKAEEGDNDEDYLLDNPRQFNLSLTV